MYKRQIYNGLMGHINKHDPVEMLGDAPGAGATGDGTMIWDAV